MLHPSTALVLVRHECFLELIANNLILGVENDRALMAKGSHWTMKIWRDGDLWGGHFTCQELPHLNHLDVMTEGSEKCIENPLAGGKAKVSIHPYLVRSLDQAKSATQE